MRERSKTDICDWLRAFLQDGPKEVSAVRKAALAAGYKRGELKEARQLCFVKSTNNWNQYTGYATEWYWSLPEDQA